MVSLNHKVAAMLNIAKLYIMTKEPKKFVSPHIINNNQITLFWVISHRSVLQEVWTDLCIFHSRLLSVWPPAHSPLPAVNTSPAYSLLSDSIDKHKYLKDNPLSFSTVHNSFTCWQCDKDKAMTFSTGCDLLSWWISLIQSRLVHDMPINSRQMHVHEEQHHLSEIKLPVLISIHQLTCYKINTRHSSTHRISSHALTLWKAHCLTLIMFSYHSLIMGPYGRPIT